GGPQPGGMQGGPPSQTVLVFVKSLAAPIVLYHENPQVLYDEMRKTIAAANPQAPKLVEKPGVGPLKKVSLLDTEISGVALQSISQ
ncbi:MAG: hypothetical protein KC462_01230, partial [Cyanobacteria bacterium HKST-UBA05]|nr:hypothetical protein [Cyanobacteria bacterium HKST-UBA05]